MRQGQSTIERDEFLAATLSVWHIPAESARRVGHPAPFPVARPRRFIELYAYAGDVVLDPFCGSGSAGVAAVEAGRRFVGYDIEEDYLKLARRRLRAAKAGGAAVARGQAQAKEAGPAPGLGVAPVAALTTAPPGR